MKSLRANFLQSAIRNPQSALIFLAPSLRYYFSRRNFDFNNMNLIRDRATVL